MLTITVTLSLRLIYFIACFIEHMLLIKYGYYKCEVVTLFTDEEMKDESWRVVDIKELERIWQLKTWVESLKCFCRK